MTQFLADLRFAFRSFRRQLGATALIVGTLALAVAANTSVFALVDAVFFRALPYPHASRLIDVNEIAPSWGLDFVGVNYPDYIRWRTAAQTIESISLWDGASFNVTSGTTTDRVEGQHVTYDLARTLGVTPVLGRSFTAEEDVPKGPKVAMIGYDMWRQRFGGAEDVVGKTLRIGSEPYTIVGVLPPNIVLDGPTNLWVPLQGDPKQQGQSYSYEGVARLKDGVSIADAKTDLMRAQEAIWRERDTSRVVSPRVMPLRDRFVADYKTIGLALGAGVVLVLLIACANVAGAMLARSVFRRREMGIRSALGASGNRLMRQLLTESLMLALIGGIVGTIVGRAGIGLIMAGVDSPPPWLHLSMDLRATLFSVLVVGVTTVLFGLAPAIQMRRQARSGALLAGSTRVSSSHAERRMLDGLVVVEIALAAILLASGGLLVRAYSNLRNIDPGFRVTGVASFRLALPQVRYRNGLEGKRLYENVVQRVRALPGVDAAGMITCPPFSCHWGNFMQAEGAPALRPGQKDPVVLLRIASGNYFQAMGLRLVHGRFYDDNEGTPQGPHPAVINEELAKQLWPDVTNPVGKRFTYRGDTVARDWMTVVGVVHDVRHYGLERPMIGGLYMSTTTMDSTSGSPSFVVVAHTKGDPDALFAPMRAIVRELDPELPLFAVKTMQAALDRSMASRRAIALWLASFAAIALVLALGGIYAMLSYVVGRRRQEIGIRMALGARGAQVLALVVRHGATLVAIGLAIGIPIALASMKLMDSLLVGVGTHDPVTYVGVVVILGFTGVLAALIPARRAAGVDPKLVMSDAG